MSIIVAMFALILGLALLLVGLRGKRIGEHPHCTACGFDLFGLPTDSARCPECGADTQSPGSRMTGRHVRRHRHLLCGFALALPSLAYLAITATPIVSNANLAPYKPVWWLASDATSPAGPLRTQAINELTIRLVSNKLSAADGDQVARSILALQSSQVNPWYPECGDLLDDLHSSGKVADERWKQYAANAVPRTSLTVRPRVRLGDPIAYRITHPAAPVGSKTQLIERVLDCEIRIADLTVKGYGGGSSSLDHSGTFWSGSAVQPRDYQGKLQPGRHHLTITQKRAIQAGFGENVEPLAIRTTTLEGDFDLLPVDQPTITLIDDASLKPAITKCLTPLLHTNTSGTLDVTTDVQRPPVGVAFRVTIIAGTTRHDASSLALPANKQTSFSHGWIRGWEASQKTVSVLYEPDVEGAANTVDVFEIYNHPIQFDNVEITPR